MMEFHVSRSLIFIKNQEPLHAGMPTLYRAKFTFAPDWENLYKTIVFKNSRDSLAMLLEDDDTCNIPWELLERPGDHLKVGVYGTRGLDTVLPTVWVDCGEIQPYRPPEE